MIRAIAARVPPPDLTVRFGAKFMNIAFWDVLYNLSNVVLWPLYPHYRWHAIHHPLAEYLGWIWRSLRAPAAHRRTSALMRRLKTDQCRLYFFPLQLATDYQLRHHSPFPNQYSAIRFVIASFAREAPAGSLLLIKCHPLDNGLIGWRRIINNLAKTFGVAERVLYAEGGALVPLIKRSAGVVTINSTVGTTALIEFATRQGFGCCDLQHAGPVLPGSARPVLVQCVAAGRGAARWLRACHRRDHSNQGRFLLGSRPPGRSRSCCRPDREPPAQPTRRLCGFSTAPNSSRR